MRLVIQLLCSALLINSAAAQASKPAEKIIALSPHAVEMLYAIGVGDKIVATTDHADYPAQANNIPRIGGYHGIQIERVLELNPDLVVVWGSGNKQEEIARIKSLGFKVFDSDPKTLAAVADELVALGELTGGTKQAQREADKYLQSLAQLQAQHADKQAVDVFYQLWSTPLMTVAKNSWIQQIIAVCNGNNVFVDSDSDYPQISIESVLLKQPQVILQSQDEGNILGVNWQQWQDIPAVKNGHVYQLDADILHRASPRAIAGVEALCSALDKAR